MVERDHSIVCQQNSKEHETKKQNDHNHQTINLTVSKETDKNNRQQYLENKIFQFEQERNNKEIPNQKIQKKDHYRIK